MFETSVKRNEGGGLIRNLLLRDTKLGDFCGLKDKIEFDFKHKIHKYLIIRSFQEKIYC